MYMAPLADVAGIQSVGGDRPLASSLAPESLTLEVCSSAFKEKLKYCGDEIDGARERHIHRLHVSLCLPSPSRPTDLHLHEYVEVRVH